MHLNEHTTEMMAETVTIHFVDEDEWSKNGGKICAYVYKKGSTYLIKDWPGTECTDIKTVGGKNVATWTLNLGDGVTASDVGIVFNGNGSQYPAKDVFWKVQDGLYYYPNGTTSTTPPSEGSGSGSEITYPTITVKSNYGQNGTLTINSILPRQMVKFILVLWIMCLLVQKLFGSVLSKMAKSMDQEMDPQQTCF